jgi:hypothetical protein
MENNIFGLKVWLSCHLIYNQTSLNKETLRAHICAILTCSNNGLGICSAVFARNASRKNSETSGFVETRNIESFIEKNWQ